MTTIKTLANISIEQLLEVFNLSFSDYIVPFFLTKEQLEDKIKSESTDLELSVGAFEDDQLIAFILHGYDTFENLKIAYNAGTGVIPAKRGSRLTSKLYDYALSVLSKRNINKILLEVITTNDAAIKTYKKIGFKINRVLNCFKGSLIIENANDEFELRELIAYDWQRLSSFWDLKPSWQNSITAVEKLKAYNVAIGIYKPERLIGYVIFNPKIKRIYQLSVDKEFRKIGIGQKLLEHISVNFGKEISLTNIDCDSKEISKFLTSRGMKIFIKQYEMELTLA